MPSTTHSTPAAPDAASERMPGELAPRGEHVVRPLQLGARRRARRPPPPPRRPPRAGSSATPSRRAAAGAPRGRGPPGGDTHVRPSRPRPPVWPSASTTVHSGAPPRASALSRSLVEPIARVPLDAPAARGPPRAASAARRGRAARSIRPRRAAASRPARSPTTSNAPSSRPSRGSRMLALGARGRREVGQARREERDGVRARRDPQRSRAGAPPSRPRRSSPAGRRRGTRRRRRRPRPSSAPSATPRTRRPRATAPGGCCGRRSPAAKPHDQTSSVTYGRYGAKQPQQHAQALLQRGAPPRRGPPASVSERARAFTSSR